MKHALASATQTSEGLARAYDGPFIFRAPLQIGYNFAITPRIPKSRTDLSNDLKELNKWAASVATESSNLPVYMNMVEQFKTRTSDRIGKLIPKTAKLGIAPFDAKGREFVDTWLLNRLVLMMHAIVAGYSGSIDCVEFVRKEIEFPHKADGNAVMLRIYEHISYIDRQIEKIAADDEDKNILRYVVDPNVKWRIATAFYQLEEFPNAARQLQGGLKLIKRRQHYKLADHKRLYPSDADFQRRVIECEWVEAWRTNKLFSSQRIFDLITSCGDLETETNNQLGIRDRAISYQCILAFQGLATLDSEYIRDLDEIDTSVDDGNIERQYYNFFIGAIIEFADYSRERKRPRSVKHTLWWRLANSISNLFLGEYKESEKENMRAQKRFRIVDWHPQSRLELYRWVQLQSGAICAEVQKKRPAGGPESQGTVAVTAGILSANIQKDVLDEMWKLSSDLSQNRPA